MRLANYYLTDEWDTKILYAYEGKQKITRYAHQISHNYQ